MSENLFKRFTKLSLSSKTLVFIFTYIICFSFFTGMWKQNRMVIDVPSYYAYLPSTIIHQDLSLHYVDKDPQYYKGKIWFITGQDGKRFIKMPMGMSVLYTPFFCIGHIYAKLTGATADGYSTPYQNAISMGIWLYLLIGLYYLRKFLLNYFSDEAVSLTLLSIALGTNLLWYSTYEGLMAHCAVFSIFSVAIFVAHRWYSTGVNKYLYLFSALFGLAFLTRSSSLLWLPFFVIYGISVKSTIHSYLSFMKERIIPILLGFIIICLIYAPQALYWQSAIGKWFYNRSTEDERFLFNDPEIFRFLLSFQKGWLIYSPLMWFSIIGLITLSGINRKLMLSILLPLIFSIYITASWWAWSYGPTFGMRPTIDYYGFLAIPMAAFYNEMLKTRLSKGIICTTTVILLLLNNFQTWQYKNNLIHFDAMSREAYFKGFFQTHTSVAWYDLLKPYSYKRRLKGLQQIEYNKEFFKSIKHTDVIYLRGYSMNFISTVAEYDNTIICTQPELTNTELFHIQLLQGDTIAIMSYNTSKYLSVKPVLNNIVQADMTNIGRFEKFVLTQMEEGDNRITLKAGNGKYFNIMPQWKNIISCNASKPSNETTFRLYTVEE